MSAVQPPAGRDQPEVGGAEHQRPDQRLRRSQRVTQSAAFREAFDQNRRFVGRHMVMWLRTGNGAALRLGVVTSRKVGNAVYRARARRRLREAYRRHRHRLAGPYDIILVARRTIVGAAWPQVEEDLLAVAARARILKC